MILLSCVYVAAWWPAVGCSARRDCGPVMGFRVGLLPCYGGRHSCRDACATNYITQLILKSLLALRMTPAAPVTLRDAFRGDAGEEDRLLSAPSGLDLGLRAAGDILRCVV